MIVNIELHLTGDVYKDLYNLGGAFSQFVTDINTEFDNVTHMAADTQRRVTGTEAENTALKERVGKAEADIEALEARLSEAEGYINDLLAKVY